MEDFMIQHYEYILENKSRILNELKEQVAYLEAEYDQLTEMFDTKKNSQT